MDKNFQELIEEAKKVKLDEKEKNSIRQFLLSFINNNPVRKEPDFRLKNIKPETAWSSSNNFKKAGIFYSLRFLLRPMTILLIIALAIAGGSSVAAENALPGDLLHLVKVNVNEEIKTFFAFSEEAKAKAETKIAGERLEEAAELAAEGRLNAEIRTKIEANFEKSADRVEARVEKMKAEGKIRAALEATSNFEAALEAHEKILERLIEINNDVRAHIIPIRTKVELRLRAVEEDKEKTKEDIKEQSGPEVKAAAEGKLTAANNKIAEVRAFIDRTKVSLGTEATAQVEAKLKVAENTVAEGRAKFEAGAFGEAFVLFQEAHQIAQEAKLMVETRQELKLEIKLESDEEDEEETKIKSEGELKIKVRLFGSPTSSSSPSPSPSPTP